MTIGINDVNRILAKAQLPYCEAERQHLIDHPMVIESVFPGATARAIAEVDAAIAVCKRVLGDDNDPR